MGEREHHVGHTVCAFLCDEERIRLLKRILLAFYVSKHAVHMNVHTVQYNRALKKYPLTFCTN